MIPAFSPAIAASVVPEVRLVIESIDVITVTAVRDDVGGVVSAAEPDLDHRDVHGRVAEDLECRRRRDFEDTSAGGRVARERAADRPDAASARSSSAGSTGRPSTANRSSTRTRCGEV